MPTRKTPARAPAQRAAAPAAKTPAKQPVKAPAKAAPTAAAKKPAPASAPAGAAKASSAPQPVKPVKAAKPAKPPKPAKTPKAPKPRDKPVRDSFTMPEADFALIAALKARALGAQRETKKSELLRAGLHALAALDTPALMAALGRLAPVKIGRPKKGH